MCRITFGDQQYSQNTQSKLVPMIFMVVSQKSNIQLQLESVVHTVSMMLSVLIGLSTDLDADKRHCDVAVSYSQGTRRLSGGQWIWHPSRICWVWELAHEGPGWRGLSLICLGTSFSKHFIKIGVSATGQIYICVKSFFYLLNTDSKHFSVNTEYLQMLSLRAEVPHFLPDVWSPSINVEETNSQLLCA